MRIVITCICWLIFNPAVAQTNNFDPLFEEAEKLLFDYKYDEAIQKINKAIALLPNEADGYILRGEIYLKKNAAKNTEIEAKDLPKNKDWASAVNDFTKAIQLNNKAYAAYYWRGTAYINAKQEENGIKDLEKALQLKPDFPDLAKEIKQFKNSFAFALSLQAEKEIEKSNEATAKKINVAQVITPLEQAITICNKGIKYNDEEPNLYLQKGKAFNLLQNYNEAYAAINKCIALDNSNKEALVLEGELKNKISAKPKPQPTKPSNPISPETDQKKYERITKDLQRGYAVNEKDIQWALAYKEKITTLADAKTWKGYRDYVTKKEGFKDANGNIVIPPEYDRIIDFIEENLIAVNKGWFVEYDEHGEEKNCKPGKWGFINLQNQVVIPFQYDYADGFRKQRARVSKNGKWGVIDNKQKVIIPMQYDYISHFENKSALIAKGGKTTSVVFALNYKQHVNAQWGLINENGKVLTEPKYDSVIRGKSGLILIKENNRWGYMNNNGSILLKPTFEEIEEWEWKYDKAIVKKNGKYGFINMQMNTVIPVQYDSALPWNKNIAAVKMKGKFGFINEKNKIIIPFIYDEIEFFTYIDEKEFFMVKRNGNSLKINREGKLVN